MHALRTPDERFTALPGWNYAPHYLDVEGLRMHYVDEGPRDAAPVLLLHGEPTWSYLYRKMIPPLAEAGHRVIAPDMIGFGRSDKPAEVSAHSYASHVEWVGALLAGLGLVDITLVCQDWGGLIGLRLAAEQGDRFSGIVAANTGLPTGDHRMPDIWWRFHDWVASADELPIGFLVDAGCVSQLADDVKAAYDAPFPDESFKAGPRAMPGLVPNRPDDPAAEANRAAWQQLQQWAKPFVCAFSDSDPITRDAEPIFHQLVPGTAGQVHTTIRNAGHFLQEDAGEDLATAVINLLARSNQE